MEETLIVIPYIEGPAQGSEIDLAVEGWRRHCKSPHRLVIVGDDPHIADVEHIPCPRISPVPGQYTAHIDIMNKLRKVRYEYPEAETFVYACDDMYAVQDFTLEDILIPKICSESIPPVDWMRESGWWRDAGKTRAMCAKHGWPTDNYVCHLPVAYSAPLLFDLYDAMDGRHTSYVWENIYYNYLRYEGLLDDPVTVTPVCRWKNEVSTSRPAFRTTEEAGSVWVTNASCGWSEALEKILANHYGLDWER